MYGKLFKMTEFVLKNNNFHLPIKCINKFQKQEQVLCLPLLMFTNLWIKWKISSYKLKSLERFIGNIFFIWTNGEDSLNIYDGI